MENQDKAALLAKNNMKESFTNQKPRVATQEDIIGFNRYCTRGVNRFRCGLCGHSFGVGDYWRWVYMGGHRLFNFLVCEKCDTSDVKEKWVNLNNEFNELSNGKFWSFTQELE